MPLFIHEVSGGLNFFRKDLRFGLRFGSTICGTVPQNSQKSAIYCAVRFAARFCGLVAVRLPILRFGSLKPAGIRRFFCGAVAVRFAVQLGDNPYRLYPP